VCERMWCDGSCQIKDSSLSKISGAQKQNIEVHTIHNKSGIFQKWD